MEELRINKDSISHISICDKKVYQSLTLGGWKDYNYYPEYTKSYFWGLYKKHLPEGYYAEEQWKNPDWKNWYTVKEANGPGKLKGINGKLYIRPRMIIYCGDKIIKTKYFDTVSLVKIYCNRHFPNVDTII